MTKIRYTRGDFNKIKLRIQKKLHFICNYVNYYILQIFNLLVLNNVNTYFLIK